MPGNFITCKNLYLEIQEEGCLCAKWFSKFFNSGLITPLKEVLSEVHPASFKQFWDYFESIFQSSKLIDEIDFDKFGAKENNFSDTKGNGGELDPNIFISDSLYAEKSKINWGHGKAKNHPRDGLTYQLTNRILLIIQSCFLKKQITKGWVTMKMHR